MNGAGPSEDEAVAETGMFLITSCRRMAQNQVVILAKLCMLAIDVP
jgi:hypothetical protein